MTLEQQVNFMSIYFICFIPITYLSFRWVYVLMCQTAGKTVEEVREKKREILRSTANRHCKVQNGAKKLHKTTLKTQYIVKNLL